MAMIQEFPDLTIPLERNQQGVIRVAGMRVSLDSILHAYYRESVTNLVCPVSVTTIQKLRALNVTPFGPVNLPRSS
jgi:hypothetical protein